MGVIGDPLALYEAVTQISDGPQQASLKQSESRSSCDALSLNGAWIGGGTPSSVTGTKRVCGNLSRR